MVDQRGIEPRLPRCKRGVLPLSLSAQFGILNAVYQRQFIPYRSRTDLRSDIYKHLIK